MNPEAARKAHEFIVGSSALVENVIEQAGEYDAKVDSSANASLAAHLVNAITVGVNTFVYQAVGPDEDVTAYEEPIRVLAAALALHDTNKYVREAYGEDVDGNTEAAFDRYFEEDDFGVDAFLGEEYRDDLLYLVQRAEIGEDSSETRQTDTEFRGLERYVRTGDQVASVALRDGVKGAHRKLAERVSSDDVHLVTFTELEQPVLNDLLLETVKRVIAGDDGGEATGVVVGSAPNAVLYLGDLISRGELRERVDERLPRRVANGEFSFSCKVTWNSFDYDILAEVGIPFERKTQIIADEFRDLLTGGPAGVEAFESVPESFGDYFAPLARAIYIEKQSEFDNPAVQEAYDRIAEKKGAQKKKIHFIAYLVRNHGEYRTFLDRLANEQEAGLRSELEPDVDAIGTVVDRFFDGLDTGSLGAKGSMCFLCGAEADEKYQKGLSALYRTQEYSRRVPPHAKYKSICPVCNLEYALFADICERSGVSTNNSVEVAYFHFDEFLGDVRVRGRRVGNVVQDDSDELDDLDVTALLGPQYYLQPVYVLNENHRMHVVRQVLQAAQDAGMKVVVGRPFTRAERADAVFVDEEATRPQELLGLDELERFGPVPEFADATSDSHLRRALALLDLIARIGSDGDLPNPYLELDRDTFHSLADFAVVNHDHATRLDPLQSYLETYHDSALMDMQTVAERGVDLFGKQFDSKYKQTKIFREAVDAFLSGMNQQMADDQLIDYVESQVYAAADREDYAGRVTTGQAVRFVDAIRTYLVENDLDDMKKLSDWEDALVNSYYYAYEQVLQSGYEPNSAVETTTEASEQ